MKKEIWNFRINYFFENILKISVIFQNNYPIVVEFTKVRS